MLPVHDRPALQWIVEELTDAGVTEIIFVTSQGQDMVEHYFTKECWYDQALKDREKHEHADYLHKVRSLAKFHFVTQEEQLGDGHAILQAQHLINDDEPVIVVFGDCLYHGDNVIEKLKKHYDKHGKSIIALQEIEPEHSHQYGIVAHQEGNTSLVGIMIEKPPAAEAPSNQAIIGRYLLSPSVWKQLSKQSSSSGEIRLIDAFQELQKEEDIHALLMEGHWLDTGTLEGLQHAGEHLKQQQKNENA